MAKYKKPSEEYQPLLYHDAPAGQPKRHRVVRGIAAVAATGALAGVLTSVGDMQRHRVANKLSTAATSTPPTEQPVPPLPTGPEAIPQSSDLKVVLAPALQGYAARVVDLSMHNVGEHTFFVSDNSISLTEIVKVDDATTHSHGSYKFVVRGKPNATGDNVDPSQVNEIQLEADSGTTPLFSESFSEDPETGEWSIDATFVTASDPVIFNLSTDPDAVGKQVLTDDTLNDVLVSANQFMQDVKSGKPVGMMPIPNFGPQETHIPANSLQV